MLSHKSFIQKSMVSVYLWSLRNSNRDNTELFALLEFEFWFKEEGKQQKYINQVLC